MKLPFHSEAPVKERKMPQPSTVPTMDHVEVAARYRATRVGGDFFDFHKVPGGRLMFMMMDIAGKRESALHIAAVAQEIFRSMGQERFQRPDAEDGGVLTDVLIAINKTVITEAGGVCCAPAFLGCYQEDIHILSYINAGHTPGILRDGAGTQKLEANGLPLGLFSHSTHDSQFCALQPGASLAVVSRGLVETRTGEGEFGIEGVSKLMVAHDFASAQELCATMLETVENAKGRPKGITGSLHLPGSHKGEPNDVTILALRRAN